MARVTRLYTDCLNFYLDTATWIVSDRVDRKWLQWRLNHRMIICLVSVNVYRAAWWVPAKHNNPMPYLEQLLQEDS